MTGMDSDTSQDIAEAISLKGGRYLEAQIQVLSIVIHDSLIDTIPGQQDSGSGRHPSGSRCWR